MGVERRRADGDDFTAIVFAKDHLPTPLPTLPHKGGGSYGFSLSPMRCSRPKTSSQKNGSSSI